jgi:hypothetical protein
LRATMGDAGRQEILTHFSWPRKCKEMSDTYLHVISRGASKEA